MDKLAPTAIADRVVTLRLVSGCNVAQLSAGSYINNESVLSNTFVDASVECEKTNEKSKAAMLARILPEVYVSAWSDVGPAERMLGKRVSADKGEGPFSSVLREGLCTDGDHASSTREQRGDQNIRIVWARDLSSSPPMIL